MNNYEKLEYIHCALQDIEKAFESDESLNDKDYLGDQAGLALAMVEDIREEYFDKEGNLIIK